MDYVVDVREATKYYSSNNVVLDKVNLKIPCGIIYGLLGPSGCGKTTLLSSIIGLKLLNSGEVYVFDRQPGSPGSDVPGSRVGYMPQEVTSITGEFTIIDCAYHFGRIYGMSEDRIEERLLFLEDLLELPPRNRYFKHLSGGQQRRVSLAVALIHEADLLVLDEPTVGLDPILCDKIWSHLLELANTKGTTVLITTHYVEEARKAHMIGLLRHGKLLCENSPHELLRKYQKSTLEEVFWLVSYQQEYCSINRSVDYNRNIETTELNVAIVNPKKSYNRQRLKQGVINTQHALLSKNFIKQFRDPTGLWFTFLLPILQATVFCVSLLNNPVKEFNIGIVNQELSTNYTTCDEYFSQLTSNYQQQCHLEMISCSFLDSMHSSVNYQYNYKYYDTDKEAEAVIAKGKLLAAITFTDNFTDSYMQRIQRGINADTDFLDESDINITFDGTDNPTVLVFKKEIYDNYFKFARDLLHNCGFNSRSSDIPLQFKQPIYRLVEADESFGIFFAPGCMVIVIFFLGISISSVVLTTERVGGVWDRLFVSGVTSTEIILSHFITQCCFSLIQTFEILIVALGIFSIKQNGDLVTLTIFCCIQGFCGTTLGFLISAICDDVLSSAYLATGVLITSIFTSGVAWPLEGLPKFAQPPLRIYPTTFGVDGVRNIVIRNWGFLKTEVALQTAGTILWSTIFVFLAVIVIKIRK